MNECYFGDCRDVLRQMIAEGVKVNMVATSPPYWGLRDYGTATWEGGDSGCDHLAGSHAWSTQVEQAKKRADSGMPYRDICGKCGAKRIDSQLGLEPTLDEFVANMVEVFGLVREILTDDGTCWINLGDNFVDKQLSGVPWRVAFALQEAGWWLRQDIIWHKPNPMPESVTDRCTKAHEYVFLMTKSARYFFDAEAIKERAVGGTPGNVTHKGKTAYEEGDEFMRTKVGLTEIGAVENRNKRSVWTIPSQAYTDAHFATFPEALVEPMILAGTSAHGHCPACGKGWVRVVERVTGDDMSWRGISEKNAVLGHGRGGALNVGSKADYYANQPQKKTLGWQPSCAHNLPPVPGVVFDPFLGSGTTAKVAQSLGRNWLGIELNPAYGKFQDNRITQKGFAFA